MMNEYKPLIIIGLVLVLVGSVVGFVKYKDATAAAKAQALKLQQQQIKEQEQQIDQEKTGPLIEVAQMVIVDEKKDPQTEELSVASVEKLLQVAPKVETPQQAQEPAKQSVKPQEPTQSTVKQEVVPAPKPEPPRQEQTARTKDVIHEPVLPKTTNLTSGDIARLQSYPLYGPPGGGEHPAFYDFQRLKTEMSHIGPGIMEVFTPEKFAVYQNARVEWLGHQDLVYRTWQSQWAVRGIVRLQYVRNDNSHGLLANTWYERHVEYRLFYGAPPGQDPKWTLDEVVYLSSSWQAVN